MRFPQDEFTYLFLLSKRMIILYSLITLFSSHTIIPYGISAPQFLFLDNMVRKLYIPLCHDWQDLQHPVILIFQNSTIFENN